MTETGSAVTRVIQSREETPTDTHKAILGQFGKREGTGPSLVRQLNKCHPYIMLSQHDTQGLASRGWPDSKQREIVG